MGRENRITNPIRDGQIARMYLLAYPARIRPYQLAEKLFGREANKTLPSGRTIGGRVKQPNKIFNFLKDNPTKKWRSSDYFDKNNQGVLSKEQPLLEEIAKTLEEKKQPLTIEEKKHLLKFLDGFFREILKKRQDIGGGDLLGPALRDYPTPLSFLKFEIGLSATLAVDMLLQLTSAQYGPPMSLLYGKEIKISKDEIKGSPFLSLGYELNSKLSNLLPLNIHVALLYMSNQTRFGPFQITRLEKPKI